MSHGIVQVHARVQKGKVVVTAMGQTNRAQRYIKGQTRLTATELGSKEFKADLPLAVAELFAQQELPFE